MVTFAVKVKKNFKLTTDQEVFDIDLKEQKQIDLDAYLHVEDAADKTLADVICTSSSTIATVNGHVVTFNGYRNCLRESGAGRQESEPHLPYR